MDPANSEKVISLKLTEEQARYIENSRQFLENETGCKVTEASILSRLLEKGLPHFEEELRRLRATAKRDAKRFQRLHLAYSQASQSL